MTSGENPGLVRQLADVKTLLAVFGLALYAILRIAYGRFYAAFGLSPDDLGLGYVELLAQSAIGAVVLLAVFGLLMWSFAAFYVNAGQALLEDVRPARDWLRGRLGERALKESAGPVLGGVALALAGLLYWQLGSVVLAVAAVAAVVVVAGVGIARGTRSMVRGLGHDPVRPGTVAAQRWRRGIAALAVVALVLAGATLIAQADMDADTVAEGRAAHPQFLGVRLTSWGAEPATLSWTTDSVDASLRPLAGVCVMYLGQSGGTIFLARGGATFRVPASIASVRIVPGARCETGMREPVR